MRKKDTDTIRLTLPQGARMPSAEEIEAAKEYVLLRSDAARLAQREAGELILEAALQLVEIGYRYGIPAQDFQFDASVNESMMDEASAVMDGLDEALYAVLEEEALACTSDSSRRASLLVVLAALGHRDRGIRLTLYAYEWRTMRQVEAFIAAMRYGNVPLDEAFIKIRSTLVGHGMSPEMKAAMKDRQGFAAKYIRNGGKATYPDGSDNVRGVPVQGFGAIMLLFGDAVAQIWMRNRLLEMQESKGVMGYCVLRGSEYPCELCDSFVGFHGREDAEGYPPYHPNCYCYTVPVYGNG